MKHKVTDGEKGALVVGILVGVFLTVPVCAWVYSEKAYESVVKQCDVVKEFRYGGYVYDCKQQSVWK